MEEKEAEEEKEEWRRKEAKQWRNGGERSHLIEPHPLSPIFLGKPTGSHRRITRKRYY